MAKNTFLVKNFCDKLKNNNFELKMLKLPENNVKTQTRNFFFQIFELGNIFQNFDQKSQKTWYFAKKAKKSLFFFAYFGTLWSKFSKILPNSKIWKTVPRKVS